MITGITGKNDEQKELIAHLCNPDIDLVVINGQLGSGKTLISTAYALHAYNELDTRKIVISRPMVPDKEEDIGFLPGNIDEKMAPYLEGFESAIDFLDEVNQGGMNSGVNHQWNLLKKDNTVEAFPLATIKGASFRNAVLILDEAQDATLSQLKKFIGRAGKGTKVIIMGDPGQITNNKIKSGLETLCDTILYGNNKDFIRFVKLNKVERSRLAQFADKL